MVTHGSAGDLHEHSARQDRRENRTDKIGVAGKLALCAYVCHVHNRRRLFPVIRRHLIAMEICEPEILLCPLRHLCRWPGRFLAWFVLLSFAADLIYADMIFDRGSDWRWRPGKTEASSPLTAWREASFNDSEFTTAPSPFWYGDVYPGGTLISGMQGNYLCLFFRKTFVITNVAEIASLELGAIVDDGFVAWINGTEVERVSMSEPTGSAVSINTLAINAVEPVQFVTYNLPPPSGYLVPGTNVIAVQVFQSSLGSSDIGFDCSLEAILREPPLTNVPPAIAAISPPVGASVRSLSEITVLFNKSVQGVDAADLLINNLPASSVTPITPNQYSFRFSEPPVGPVTVAWAADHGIRDLDSPPKSFAGGNWSYILDPSGVEQSPYISEFMASNTRTLADENGDYSDWIEIYNPNPGTVNLDGWYLTDSTNNLGKWRFPATNIAGGGFVVVFASEKDRRVPGSRLHTNFRLSAEGEYLALIKDDGTTIASEFRPAFPPQVPDVSYGFVQFGEPPFLNATSNSVYFTRPTPGAANAGGTQTPGPVILNVQHTPNVPLENDDLLVTAQVLPSFYSIGTVVMRYRIMFGNEVAAQMFDDGTHGDTIANDGIFAAVIPASASTTGQMIRYYIAATDVNSGVSRWPLYTDPGSTAQYLGTVVNPNYVTSSIPIIHLFAPPNILQPGPNTSGIGADSQAGSRGVSVFYDGEFYDNIYVSLRGNTTAGYPKKSHRFEFNHEHLFRHPGVGFGWPEKPGPRIRRTSFEADYPDPTYMRQGMSFWLCEQAGSPASFYYPVRLQLNGQFYQLANHNDVQTEELLDRLGYDRNGALYNAVGTVQPNQFSTGGFEKKTREWEGNGDYLQLASAIAETLPVGTRRMNIFDMLDLPNVINYLVAARFVQENDDVWANMSLYHDNDGDNLWRIISFDMNLSWGAFFMDNPNYDGGIQATNDKHKSFPLYGSSQALSLTSGNYNRIYDVIFDVPQTLEMFRRRMRTVLDAFVRPPGSSANSSAVEQKVLAWRDLILSDGAVDRAKWGWPGIGGQNNLPPASVSDGVNDLLEQFFYPRRDHFYGKHSVANTALAIGTSKAQNAGFPLPQPGDSAVEVIAIEFNPVSGNQDEEYICLTNSAAIALDISSWKLDGAVAFTFAPGTVIPSKSAFYVSPNVRAFRARAMSPRGHEGHFVLGPYSGQLSARGETLRVLNDLGVITSTFTYTGAPSAAQQFLRISEIMYHPAQISGNPTPAENYEFIELKNISTNTTLDLSGVRFTNGIFFNFTGSAITSLAPGASLVVVKNLSSFIERYGPGLPVAGQYSGALDNSGERIRLIDSAGEEILDFSYDNKWYPATDGDGFSLVIADENADPDTWNNKSNWKPSPELNGSPGNRSLMDTDQDGLPDEWEIEYGLNPNVNDAGLDSDGDTMSNLAEYIAGTNPVDSLSYLKLKQEMAMPGVALEFLAISNRTYTVEFTEGLEKPVWQKLTDIDAGPINHAVILNDLIGTTNRFYRLLTPKRP
jgi:hypothetical protein